MEEDARGSSVKVAIRCRPPIESDTRFGEEDLIIAMEGQQTLVFTPKIPGMDLALTSIASGVRDCRTFTFDASLNSYDAQQDNYASQADVFQSLGRPLLDDIWNGFNCTVFAYGQTGSGKSYTMMGTEEEPGFIPRLNDALFASIEARARGGGPRDDEEGAIQDGGVPLSPPRSAAPEVLVEVSFFEIYNEKVADLLCARDEVRHLKIRECPVNGPHVDGLSHFAVKSAEDIAELLERGNMVRSEAATRMNERSSRSHSIFTIKLVQVEEEEEDDMAPTSITSTIHLVDLAGSERLAKSEATGARMKETTEINKSLHCLGRVILELSEGSKFVPYRDSALTWVLRDSLGGNAKSLMLATIAPVGCFFDETLSTLRFAARTKRVINDAVVNVQRDPNALLIKELRDEIDRLAAENDALQENSTSPDEAIELRRQVLHLRHHAQASAHQAMQLKEELAVERAARIQAEDECVRLRSVSVPDAVAGDPDLHAQELQRRLSESEKARKDAERSVVHYKKQIHKCKFLIRELRARGTSEDHDASPPQDGEDALRPAAASMSNTDAQQQHTAGAQDTYPAPVFTVALPTMRSAEGGADVPRTAMHARAVPAPQPAPARGKAPPARALPAPPPLAERAEGGESGSSQPAAPRHSLSVARVEAAPCAGSKQGPAGVPPRDVAGAGKAGAGMQGKENAQHHRAVALPHGGEAGRPVAASPATASRDPGRTQYVASIRAVLLGEMSDSDEGWRT